eukprot:671295-Pyramimonas_sp.AAC.1
MGCADMRAWGARAGGGTGAIGGAPYGSTKRVMGCADMRAWGARAGGGAGAIGGAPYGATK